MKDEAPWPCTILFDRYDGTYSGGKWTAWNSYVYEVPQGPNDGDTECSDFWGEGTEHIGRGETPDEAIKDLNRRLEKLK